MGYELPDPAAASKKIRELFFEAFPEYIANDVQVRVRKTPFLVDVLVRACQNERIQVAGFKLVQQENCCGALVSTKTFVHEDWRGKGIAQGMMPLKEAIAREFGYSALCATVNITGNPAEAHILEKCGWILAWSFGNARTNNRVGFFFKELIKR